MQALCKLSLLNWLHGEASAFLMVFNRYLSIIQYHCIKHTITGIFAIFSRILLTIAFCAGRYYCRKQYPEKKNFLRFSCFLSSSPRRESQSNLDIISFASLHVRWPERAQFAFPFGRQRFKKGKHSNIYNCRALLLGLKCLLDFPKEDNWLAPRYNANDRDVVLLRSFVHMPCSTHIDRIHRICPLCICVFYFLLS